MSENGFTVHPEGALCVANVAGVAAITRCICILDTKGTTPDEHLCKRTPILNSQPFKTLYGSPSEEIKRSGEEIMRSASSS